MLSGVVESGVSKCSGGPIFIFSLTKIGFAP